MSEKLHKLAASLPCCGLAPKLLFCCEIIASKMQGFSTEKESRFFCCEKYNVYSMAALVVEF
ncbi:MAG: hypothetical protein CL811_01270 [Colwelliaceae bacterium]|nr:hypothetical protein [Colwelliaceae bacterium]